MVEYIIQFAVVVGVSFAVLVALTSYFRFQNKVSAAAAAKKTSLPVGEEPFTYLLAGQLATGPRDPDPCLVVLVELQERERFLDQSPEGLDELCVFMTEHLRACVRACDALVCLEPGRHGLLIQAGADEAGGVLHRLACAFDDDVFSPPGGDATSLHVRVGAAACPEDGTGVNELLAAAAEALQKTSREAPWALFTPRDPAPTPAPDPTDPLADVPETQHHLVDPATGVLKEDHLGSTMQRFVARARNRGKPSSIVCLEIEQFDRYRELYGTAGADYLLASLAWVLKHDVREDDLLARYGEGQFVVLLGCPADRALHVMQRIGHDVHRRPLTLPSGGDVMIKLAAGVAGCPDHGSVPSDIFKHALTALAHAGTAGKAPFLVYQADMAAHLPQDAARESF
jgi:diguanylate cyclase (GGDEF)-like protein